MDFPVNRISVKGILGMDFLAEQKYMLCLDKGVPAWKGVAIPLVGKNCRLLAKKVQVL